MNMLQIRLRGLWVGLRRLAGDDAYERYLEHWRTKHAGEGKPLDRGSFLRRETERRWSGINRCC